MSVAENKKLEALRILWISLGDGSLRMMWTDGEIVEGRNDIKERCHGR
jgi:hypothetical protein